MLIFFIFLKRSLTKTWGFCVALIASVPLFWAIKINYLTNYETIIIKGELLWFRGSGGSKCIATLNRVKKYIYIYIYIIIISLTKQMNELSGRRLIGNLWFYGSPLLHCTQLFSQLNSAVHFRTWQRCCTTFSQLQYVLLYLDIQTTR